MKITRLKEPGLRGLWTPLYRQHCKLSLLSAGRLRAYASSPDSLPYLAQPSLWQSMIPRVLRERKSRGAAIKASTAKDWNPATFYIVIFLLIGSNAIQMIALRNSFASFSRTADAKIRLLKDVLGRVQRGEAVDVEGLLGTGNEKQEKEWEEVLREIEQREQLWEPGEPKKRRKVKEAKKAATETSFVDGKATGSNTGTSRIKSHGQEANTQGTAVHAQGPRSPDISRRPLAFY